MCNQTLQHKLCYALCWLTQMPHVLWTVNIQKLLEGCVLIVIIKICDKINIYISVIIIIVYYQCIQHTQNNNTVILLLLVYIKCISKTANLSGVQEYAFDKSWYRPINWLHGDKMKNKQKQNHYHNGLMCSIYFTQWKCISQILGHKQKSLHASIRECL